GGNLIQGGKPVSAETVKRYIAEVKFLRAWYYFELITVFKEVPLITQIEDPSTRKEKASLTELRAQLYKDLDEAIAESHLPRSNGFTSEECGRVSTDAVVRLRARARLIYASLMEHNLLSGYAVAEYSEANAAAPDSVN